MGAQQSRVESDGEKSTYVFLMSDGSELWPVSSGSLPSQCQAAHSALPSADVREVEESAHGEPAPRSSQASSSTLVHFYQKTPSPTDDDITFDKFDLADDTFDVRDYPKAAAAAAAHPVLDRHLRSSRTESSFRLESDPDEEACRAKEIPCSKRTSSRGSKPLRLSLPRSQPDASGPAGLPVRSKSHGYPPRDRRGRPRSPPSGESAHSRSPRPQSLRGGSNRSKSPTPAAKPTQQGATETSARPQPLSSEAATSQLLEKNQQQQSAERDPREISRSQHPGLDEAIFQRGSKPEQGADADPVQPRAANPGDPSSLQQHGDRNLHKRVNFETGRAYDAEAGPQLEPLEMMCGGTSPQSYHPPCGCHSPSKAVNIHASLELTPPASSHPSRKSERALRSGISLTIEHSCHDLCSLRPLDQTCQRERSRSPVKREATQPARVQRPQQLTTACQCEHSILRGRVHPAPSPSGNFCPLAQPCSRGSPSPAAGAEPSRRGQALGGTEAALRCASPQSQAAPCSLECAVPLRFVSPRALLSAELPPVGESGQSAPPRSQTPPGSRGTSSGSSPRSEAGTRRCEHIPVIMDRACCSSLKLPHLLQTHQLSPQNLRSSEADDDDDDDDDEDGDEDGSDGDDEDGGDDDDPSSNVSSEETTSQSLTYTIPYRMDGCRDTRGLVRIPVVALDGPAPHSPVDEGWTDRSQVAAPEPKFTITKKIEEAFPSCGYVHSASQRSASSANRRSISGEKTSSSSSLQNSRSCESNSTHPEHRVELETCANLGLGSRGNVTCSVLPGFHCTRKGNLPLPAEEVVPTSEIPLQGRAGSPTKEVIVSSVRETYRSERKFVSVRASTTHTIEVVPFRCVTWERNDNSRQIHNPEDTSNSTALPSIEEHESSPNAMHTGILQLPKKAVMNNTIASKEEIAQPRMPKQEVTFGETKSAPSKDSGVDQVWTLSSMGKLVCGPCDHHSHSDTRASDVRWSSIIPIQEIACPRRPKFSRNDGYPISSKVKIDTWSGGECSKFVLRLPSHQGSAESAMAEQFRAARSHLPETIPVEIVPQSKNSECQYKPPDRCFEDSQVSTIPVRQVGHRTEAINPEALRKGLEALLGHSLRSSPPVQSDDSSEKSTETSSSDSTDEAHPVSRSTSCELIGANSVFNTKQMDSQSRLHTSPHISTGSTATRKTPANFKAPGKSPVQSYYSAVATFPIRNSVPSASNTSTDRSMGKHPGERTPDSWLAESSLRNRGCCHRHQRPSWRTRSLCTRPHCGGECQPLLQPGSVHAGFQPLRFHGAPGRSACPRRCLPASPRVSPRCLDRGQSPEPAYDQKQDDHRETSDKACQDHKTIKMADKTCEARINTVTCRCSSSEARLEPERCQRSVGQGVTSDDLPLSRVLEASKNASRLQEVQWPSGMPSTRPQAQFFDNSTMTALRAADLSFLRIHWQTAPVDFIRKSLLTEPDVQGMRKEDFLGHPIPSAPAIPELPSISSVPMITKFHAFSGSARVHALPLTPGAPVIPPAPAIAADAEVILSPDIPQIPDVPVVPPDLCQCLIDSKNRQAGKGEAPELQVCRAGINRPLTENDLDDALDLYESGQMLKHGYFLRCCLCLKTDLTSPEVLGGTTTPRALPCLHTFCQGCLGDWICRDKTAGAASSFLCPLCRRRVEVDAHTSAQNWAATFPINVYLVALENVNPKNFLERYGFSTDCARCGAPCHRPKALACLHCLCLRCLKRMVRLSWDGQGGAVACPVCRRLSLPERPDFPRSLWADSFPDNPFLELLLEPRPSDSFWTCLHAVYVQCTSCGAMSCSTCSKILGFKAKVKRWCRVCARRLKLKRLFGRRRPSLVTCTCSTCHGSLRTEEGQPCLHALCSTCISDSFHNNLAQMAKHGHLCPTCRRHGLPSRACLPGELQDLVEEMTPCRCGGSDTGVQAGREDTYCRACQARICARCCLFYPREAWASPSLLPIPTRALREAGGDPSRMTIRDIAVMPGCRLLAADSGNRCLLAWSWSHAPHQSCLSLPPCPHSVAVLDSSRVAVAMPSASQLVVVEVGKDATLRQLYTTSLSRQIHHLTPLTRNVLAGTAPEDKVVEVVGVQGRHLATLCGSQTERCQLAWPQYLTATPSGDVILTDPCANKVFCLTASGQSSWTLGEGPFTQPMGVCADSDGQIFVVDGTGSCVWRLSRDGLRVEKFPATGELSLQNARSCTWHNGTLFVANSESVQTIRTDLETLS